MGVGERFFFGRGEGLGVVDFSGVGVGECFFFRRGEAVGVGVGEDFLTALGVGVGGGDFFFV